MDIPEAVKTLRAAYGEAQQAFSNRLKMSMASIANFETGARTPDGSSAVKLARAATEIGRPELAAVFEEIVRDAMGGIIAPIRNEDEHRTVRAVQFVLFDPRFEHLREPLKELLAPVDRHLRGIERRLQAKSKEIVSGFDALADKQKGQK